MNSQTPQKKLIKHHAMPLVLPLAMLTVLTACNTTHIDMENKPIVIPVTIPVIDAGQVNTPSTKPSVIVIGGGLSGLSAAYELEQQNYQVRLLEANYRLGGRVISKEFANGQIAEGGGELIDEDSIHPQVHHYVNKFGLQLADSGYDDKSLADGAYYLDHKLFAYDDLEEILGEKAAADDELFWEELYELGQLIDDATNPTSSKNARELDSQSALQWVDSLELHPQIRKTALHHIRAEYGEPANLSLLFLAQQQKTYEDVEDDGIEIYRVAGGNSQLVNGFVKNLEGSVHLNTPVVSLNQDGNTVTAMTNNGDTYKADYVVVTVPSTVLNKINFSPVLPVDKQTAANELHYGQHSKVLLQYNNRFWLDRKLGGDVISELPIGWVWEATQQQKGTQGVLVTYTSGDMVKEESHLTDYKLVEKRQQEIEKMYPEAKGALIDSQVYRWDQNPWVLGGYTSYSPNQVMPFWGVFTKPHQRIYFAGEHTDTLLPGYMEGAMRSGQRVAEQLAEKLTQ